MKKGSYGYLKKKKTYQIGLTCFLIIIGLIIYIIGYYLNNEQNNNVFTIIAVLMVLPAAKALTSFIAVAPFKTANLDKYKEVKSKIPGEAILLTDLVLTSAEKIMNLDFLVLIDNNVIGVIGKQNQDSNYILKYLNKELQKQEYPCDVHIFNDYKAFLNHFNSIEPKPQDQSVLNAVKDYILTYAI